MLPLQEGLVYGPVRSRRLGRSLGLNILPHQQKVCTFNCSYCQYGWTSAHAADAAGPWPSPASVAKAVSRRLAALLEQGHTVDRLTIAGNGEPTLHPELGQVIEAVREVRAEIAPAVPVAILSNASTVTLPAVRQALDRLDERYMKLDAGDPGLFRRINAARVPLGEVVSGLASLKELVVQAMFVKDRTGRLDNSTDLAVQEWIGQLHAIRPRLVHVYTIDRPAAWPYLQPVAADRLEEIAARVRAAGFEAAAFNGHARP